MKIHLLKGTSKNSKSKACDIDKSGTDAASERKVVLARTFAEPQGRRRKQIGLRQMSILTVLKALPLGNALASKHCSRLKALLAMERNADFGVFRSSQNMLVKKFFLLC